MGLCGRTYSEFITIIQREHLAYMRNQFDANTTFYSILFHCVRPRERYISCFWVDDGVKHANIACDADSSSSYIASSAPDIDLHVYVVFYLAIARELPYPAEPLKE